MHSIRAELAFSDTGNRVHAVCMAYHATFLNTGFCIARSMDAFKRVAFSSSLSLGLAAKYDLGVFFELPPRFLSRD